MTEDQIIKTDLSFQKLLDSVENKCGSAKESFQWFQLHFRMHK